MNSHQMSYVSDKLAKFFYKAVSVPNHNFRQGILESIHDIFGYQRVTYWVSDNNNELIDPYYINVEHDIMESYEKIYYKYDPMRFKNLKKGHKKRYTLLINDIVDKEVYAKQNVYYRDILGKYDYINKMALYLKGKDCILGGISLLRKSNEPIFTMQDVYVMELVAKFLSNLMQEHEETKKSAVKNEFFSEYINYQADGLMIINDKKEIVYMNKGAQEALYDLAENKKDSFSIDSFAEMLYNKKIFLNEYTFEVNGYKICVNGKKIYNNLFYAINFTKCMDSMEIVTEKKIAYQTNLSKKEKEVVSCLIKGMSNSEIASELFVSEQTIKTHLYNIYLKYDVSSRNALIYKILSE